MERERESVHTGEEREPSILFCERLLADMRMALLLLSAGFWRMCVIEVS